MDEFLLGTKTAVNNAQEQSLGKDLMIYIFLAILFVLVLVFTLFAYIILKKFRDKIMKMVMDKKKVLVFSGILRS